MREADTGGHVAARGEGKKVPVIGTIQAECGKPDFVYRPATRRRGSGRREIGDHLILLGHQLVVVSIKSRDIRTRGPRFAGPSPVLARQEHPEGDQPDRGHPVTERRRSRSGRPSLSSVSPMASVGTG